MRGERESAYYTHTRMKEVRCGRETMFLKRIFVCSNFDLQTKVERNYS